MKKIVIIFIVFISSCVNNKSKDFIEKSTLFDNDKLNSFFKENQIDLDTYCGYSKSFKLDNDMQFRFFFNCNFYTGQIYTKPRFLNNYKEDKFYLYNNNFTHKNTVYNYNETYDLFKDKLNDTLYIVPIEWNVNSNLEHFFDNLNESSKTRNFILEYRTNQYHQDKEESMKIGRGR
jgi:hypothetical protein